MDGSNLTQMQVYGYCELAQVQRLEQKDRLPTMTLKKLQKSVKDKSHHPLKVINNTKGGPRGTREKNVQG